MSSSAETLDRRSLRLVVLPPWLALVAASYWITRALAEEVFPSDMPLSVILCAAGAVGIGTQLAGLGLWFVAWRQHTPFPAYAGERLWVCEAATLVLRLALLTLLRTLNFSSPPVTVTVAFIAGGLYLHGMRRTAPRRWKWVFAVGVAMQFSLAINSMLPAFVPSQKFWILSIGVYAVQILLILFAFACDLWTARRQPSEHWIGAALPLWNAAVLLGAAALYAYIHDVV